MISTVTGKGYRPTHENHPLTIWVKRNINWTSAYYLALASEYAHRAGRPHGTLRVIGDVAFALADASEHTGHFNYARNRKRKLDFLWVRDVYQAYRMYLRARWVNDVRPPRWTNRKPPDWLDMGEGTGSDGQLLACRARRYVGFAQTGDHGHIDCPACGDIIEWYCEGVANYVELRCVTPDCLHWKEVLRK